MIKGSLARRYARALMAIGQEQGIYERLGEEIRSLAALAAEEDSLALVFKAPVVSKEVREKIIEEIAKSGGFHDVNTRFLKLLNQKGRLPWLEQISEAYGEMLDEAEGRTRAEVVSAVKLSPEAEDSIKQALSKITGKAVIMDVSVDDSLIGGVIARAAGKLFDGSVRTQLLAIQEKLKTEGGL